MFETLKKVNNALRIIFVGFTVIFALVKIFDIAPKNDFRNTENDEQATSEFDEIW